MLLDAGADINLMGRRGSSPLFEASKKGRKEIVKLLLTHPNIDINTHYRWGKAALRIAKEKRRKEIIEMLEAAGIK